MASQRFEQRFCLAIRFGARFGLDSFAVDFERDALALDGFSLAMFAAHAFDIIKTLLAIWILCGLVWVTFYKWYPSTRKKVSDENKISGDAANSTLYAIEERVKSMGRRGYK